MPRCLFCKSKFIAKVFNQKHCLETKECFNDFTLWKKEQIKKANDKKWKTEKAILKEKIKTLSQYEADAKKSFQKWIRLRDADLNCISCNGNDKDLWDGGHFKKAEIYSGVIFNENNCHKQCRKCNRYLNGNELMYRQGLVKRYGENFVKDIEQLANDTRQVKFTKEMLIAKKMQYDIKIKELINNQK
jgi:hypothetical protein